MAAIHVATKISPMTRIPPTTGTTARANGERSRGGRTGEPGTISPVAVSTCPFWRRVGTTPRAAPRVRGASRGLVTTVTKETTSVDLFEYQGKQYFARYGIPVSPGGVAETVDEAVAEADKAGYPVVVKAQVQVGGRGKAGGIKLANDAAEVRTHAGNILGMDIKGHRVERVWVENASDIDEEYYASFTLDRAAKQHLLMLSAQGGVEIEEVAEKDPDAIVKLHINPVDGLDAGHRPAGGGGRQDPGEGARRRRRRSSSSSTTASSRATATWPRSTR